MIHFVRYEKPTQKPMSWFLERHPDIEAIARRLHEDFCCSFTMEDLPNGYANLRVEIPSDKDIGPVAMQVCVHPAAMPRHVDDLMKDALRRLEDKNEDIQNTKGH